LYLSNSNFGWILIKKNEILLKKGIKKFQILEKTSDKIILIKKQPLSDFKINNNCFYDWDVTYETLFWSISTFNKKIIVPSNPNQFCTSQINNAWYDSYNFQEKHLKLKKSNIIISKNFITINYKLEDICYIWLYLDGWENAFKWNNEKFEIIINNNKYYWKNEIEEFFSNYTLIEALVNSNSCKIPFNYKNLGAIDILLEDENEKTIVI